MVEILLIQDQSQQADIAMRVLTSEGFTVKHAPSAARALLALHQSCPNLILLDLNLPDIDGQTVALVVKQQLGESAPPIVALSMQDDDLCHKMARQAGCEAVLLKPIQAQ